jgi:hypothetical protein
MVTLSHRSTLLPTIAGVDPPDSRIARDAAELARDASSDVLFHHVMRSYYFGEKRAAAEFASYDREVVLLSLVLHDLGLTDHARGPRRFEIEGADVARQFATSHGLAEEKAWLVWDNIALHPLDLNLYKQPEARAVEWGIWADVLGWELDMLGRDAVAEIVAAFPRLGFKRELLRLLRQEAEAKPTTHLFHPCTMVAHHCLGGVSIPDARPMIDGAPFDEGEGQC